MTPVDSSELRPIIDELANALQTAIVLSGRLATSLRADCHDADVLYDAIGRATIALHRLRPTQWRCPVNGHQKQPTGQIDPTVMQLLREAYDLLTDSASPLDLRDWLKAARSVIAAEG